MERTRRKRKKICQFRSMDPPEEFVEKFLKGDNMDACFTAFDKNGDGLLDIKEFNSLCRALFRNDRGKIYALDSQQLRDIFDVFDRNLDGFIDRNEFVMCWNNWIKTIVRPVNAFLIIDVQNDFISGSLNISKCSAQQNGLDVIDPINRLLDTVDFDVVFYSFDWHPTDHVSFIDNLPNRKLHPSSPVTADKAQLYDTVTFEGPPMMKQRLWPRHCVQDSWGAELHKDLKVVEGGIKIYKGTNPEVDSYSVFWDNKKLERTTLDDQLQAKNATDIYVCGLAYDVCVGATAVDALAHGYRVVLIDDCCRGVDIKDIEKTKNTVMMNNGIIVDSSKVKPMVEGRDRRPELGYKLAMELKDPHEKEILVTGLFANEKRPLFEYENIEVASMKKMFEDSVRNKPKPGNHPRRGSRADPGRLPQDICRFCSSPDPSCWKIGAKLGPRQVQGLPPNGDRLQPPGKTEKIPRVAV